MCQSHFILANSQQKYIPSGRVIECSSLVQRLTKFVLLTLSCCVPYHKTATTATQHVPPCHYFMLDRTKSWFNFESWVTQNLSHGSHPANSIHVSQYAQLFPIRHMGMMHGHFCKSLADTWCNISLIIKSLRRNIQVIIAIWAICAELCRQLQNDWERVFAVFLLCDQLCMITVSDKY